jgi:hypothetical protein
MRLMCWDVDIVHRSDSQLVNADYWSQLGSDIEYGLLLCDHLKFTRKTRTKNPLPTELPMHPENMPYYRGPRFQATASLPNNPDELHIQTLLTNIIVHWDLGHMHLSHMLVKFGRLSNDVSVPNLGGWARLNSKFVRYARQVMGFDWAVYSFSNNDFSSTIATRNLPFWITLGLRPIGIRTSAFPGICT